MLPIERFHDEGHNIGASSAEKNCVDWNAFRIFPFLRDNWTLLGGCGETGVGMGGRPAGIRRPWAPQPIDEFTRFLIGHAFPPDIPVGRNGTAQAVETPIGRLPVPGGLDTQGLDISPANLAKLLEVDVEGWLAEVPMISEFFAGFGDRMPAALKDEVAQLEQRLRKK